MISSFRSQLNQSSKQLWRRRAYHVHSGNPIQEPFKILFLGRDEFSVLVLSELFKAKDVWSELHVITYPDERKGRRGSILDEAPLRLKAEEYNLPVHLIPRSRDEFKQFKPPALFCPSADASPSSSHIALTASFGRILSSTFLNCFLSSNRLNIHPSLLPLYRGPAPIQHAILNGDKETGVSVISMLKWKEGMDSGDMWGMSKIPLTEDDYFEPLRDKLAVEGAKLAISVLRQKMLGKAVATPQSAFGIPEPYPKASLISKDHSFLYYDRMTAEAAMRVHRAISHQRPLTTMLGEKRLVQLHSPKVVPPSPEFPLLAPGEAIFHKPTDQLLIALQPSDPSLPNSLLGVPTLKSQGKALIPALGWWNGIKSMGLVSTDQRKMTTFRNPPPPSDSDPDSELSS